MAGKTHGERIERLEQCFAGIREDIGKIEKHLCKLNGAVAENSKFRLQQKTVYGVLAFAWASVFVPSLVVAVAVLT